MNVLRDQKPAPVAPPEVHRELLARLPRKSPQALVLSGVRRCGKSTLQAQLMKRHRAAAYINFEDTRLFGLTPEDFQTILSILEELAPKRPVFLDEVQEAPDWQRLVYLKYIRGAPGLASLQAYLDDGAA